MSYWFLLTLTIGLISSASALVGFGDCVRVTSRFGSLAGEEAECSSASLDGELRG